MVIVDDIKNTTYDYVIAGGGLAGCVLASRLTEADPSLKVLLVEAGNDDHSNPGVMAPLAAVTLHGTPLQWNYKSTPQEHLGGRRVDLAGGKMLSGSSGVNYGVWTRGHSTDWNLLSKVVNDDGWSYDKMLPYFRKTEHYHDSQTNPSQHGYQGPIHIQGGGTEYPLRKVVQKMWTDAGVPTNSDHNDGHPLGCAIHTENWHKSARQPAGVAYSLANVHVLTNSLVRKILIEEGSKSANGIELDDGHRIMAAKEVIVCCGAMRSPQLLMLSGIGPADQLKRLNIPLLHENPAVGADLHDHGAVVQLWKLKNTGLGYSLDGAALALPKYNEGLPAEWLVTSSAPEEEWEAAIRKEGLALDPVDGPRANIECFMAYLPMSGATAGLQIIPDGTHISTVCLNLLPRARGTVSLGTTNVADMPLVNPNYGGAEADMVVMRAAMRLILRALESSEGRELIESEATLDGWDHLTSQSSDAEFDRRIRDCTVTLWHYGGSLSMGTVVDSQCRVKGVSNLRVVDASILPIPLSCHYQAPISKLNMIQTWTGAKWNATALDDERNWMLFEELRNPDPLPSVPRSCLKGREPTVSKKTVNGEVRPRNLSNEEQGRRTEADGVGEGNC